MIHPLSNTLVVKESKFGKGLFALIDIPAFTILFQFGGQVLRFEDTVLLRDQESYPVQIDINMYIYPDQPFSLVNHSCDPNCGIRDNTVLIAIKNITAGEELLYDYSTTMLERHWTMQCKCGSRLCRNIISDFDLLPLALQEHYLQIDIVQPYIKQHVDVPTH